MEYTKRGFTYKPSPRRAWHAGSKKATARFGAAPLMPSGHGWANYRVGDELQRRGNVESYCCTVYASLKAWLTLYKYHNYGMSAPLPLDCAERFNAVMAGIVPPGANPHDVCESIRTWGVISQSLLPFDDSIKTTDDFFKPKPMDEDLVAKAKKTVQAFDWGHEYIFNDAPNGSSTPGKPAMLKNALTRGTVCISMYAWKFNGQYYYKDVGDVDEHWIHLLDFSDGDYWLIEDQYPDEQGSFLKKIKWDTDFQTAELFFLQPNVSGIAPNDRSLLSNLIRLAQDTVTRLMLQFKG